MQSTAGYSSSTAGIPATVLAASSRHQDRAAQVSLVDQSPKPAHSLHQSAATLLADPNATSFLDVVPHYNATNQPCGPQYAQPAPAPTSSTHAIYDPTTPRNIPVPPATVSYTLPRHPSETQQSAAATTTTASSAQTFATAATAPADKDACTASTSQQPSAVDPLQAQDMLTFANMDLRLLLSTLETVAGVDPSPQLRAQPKPNIRRQHFFDEEADPLNQPPSLGYRTMTPFEACFLYAQGKFEFLDVPVESDLRTHRFATPIHARAALRLAQTLTVAANFDHTFNIAHLSVRDLLMIDAFLRNDIYTTLRDKIVGESYIPSSAAQAYPCIRDLPVLAAVQSLKGLHAATKKLTDFRTELYMEIDHWRTSDKVLDALEHLATLSYNLVHHRNIVDMYVTPIITAPAEDICNFVDMLDYHNASPLAIQLFYNAATAELAHAYNVHQALTTRFRHLCSPQAEDPVTNIPLTRTPPTSTWTTVTSAQTTFKPSSSHSIPAEATVTQEQHAPSTSAHADPSPPSSTSASSSSPATSTTIAQAAQPSFSDTGASSTEANPYPYPKHTPAESITSQTAPIQHAEKRYHKVLATQPARQPTEISSSASTSSAASTAPPTPSPAPAKESELPKRFSGCLFCGSSHYTASCEVVKHLTDRCVRIADAGRCFKCLYLHAPGYCQRDKMCSLCCDRHHHPALCANNRRQVVNDVSEDLPSFYKRMIGYAAARYEELYRTSRRQ